MLLHISLSPCHSHTSPFFLIPSVFPLFISFLITEENSLAFLSSFVSLLCFLLCLTQYHRKHKILPSPLTYFHSAYQVQKKKKKKTVHIFWHNFYISLRDNPHLDCLTKILTEFSEHCPMEPFQFYRIQSHSCLQLSSTCSHTQRRHGKKYSWKKRG